MQKIAITFPDHRAEIAAMCARDPTMAQICDDYEILANLLPRDLGDPALKDIRNSMAGLEEEIRLRLGLLGAQENNTAGRTAPAANSEVQT